MRKMILSYKKQFKQTPAMVSLLTFTILVFIVEILMSHNHTSNGTFLVKMGAKWGPLITQHHEYWRFITAMFLHASVMHIFSNMLTLWFIGIMAENIFGSFKLICLYLFGGIFGNIASYLFEPMTISVGASSALFALFGGLILYTWHYKSTIEIKNQRNILLLFVALNLIGGLLTSGIDLWGHVGGLIGGVIFIAMAGFENGDNYAPSIRWSLLIVTIIIIVLTICSKDGLV